MRGRDLAESLKILMYINERGIKSDTGHQQINSRYCGNKIATYLKLSSAVSFFLLMNLESPHKNLLPSKSDKA